MMSTTSRPSSRAEKRSVRSLQHLSCFEERATQRSKILSILLCLALEEIQILTVNVLPKSLLDPINAKTKLRTLRREKRLLCPWPKLHTNAMGAAVSSQPLKHPSCSPDYDLHSCRLLLLKCVDYPKAELRYTYLYK